MEVSSVFVYMYVSSHTTQTTHWLDPRIASLQQDGRLKLAADGMQGW